jgi:hypothetical protein
MNDLDCPRFYAELPDDLNIDLSLAHQSAIQLMRFEAGADFYWLMTTFPKG